MSGINPSIILKIVETIQTPTLLASVSARRSAVLMGREHLEEIPRARSNRSESHCSAREPTTASSHSL